MKKVLFISFLLISSFFCYSQTRVTAPIITNSITDTTYSVTYDSLVKGGYRTLATKLQRDSIPLAERKYGMLVYVSNVDTCYQLKDSSLSNSNWYAFKFSSGKSYTAGTDIKIAGDSISADTTIGNTKLATQGYVLRNISSTSPDSTYFKDGGNSFGKTAILGTNDPNDLSIRREGLQYMLLNGGNVFFGTKQASLSTNRSIDTFGNAVLQTVSSLYSLQIPKDTNRNILSDANYSRISGEANTGHLYFQNYNGGNWNKIAFTTDITSGNVTGTGVAQRIPYWNSSNNISYTNNLVYDTALIRLGIGTSTPSSALDIHSSTNNMADLNNSSYTGSSFLLFQKVDTTKWKIGNNYNSGANTFEVQNITKLNTPLSIDTNSKVTFINSPYVGNKRVADTTDYANRVKYTDSLVTFNTPTKAKNDSTTLATAINGKQASGNYAIADSSVWQPKYRSDTMRASVYNQLANKANLNAINTFTTSNYFKSIYANKDSIPIVTGKIWGLVEDTATGRVSRQALSSGGGLTGSGTVSSSVVPIATWSATNTRLSSTKTYVTEDTTTGKITFNSSVTASTVGIGTSITDTIKAAANNDTLVGLDINPSFTAGSYTGTKNWGTRIRNGGLLISNSSSVGTAASPYFNCLNGSLGGTIGNTVNLATFGTFVPVNVYSLGINAYRTATTTGYLLAGIKFQINIDNSSDYGGNMYLTTSKKVGINVNPDGAGGHYYGALTVAGISADNTLSAFATFNSSSTNLLRQYNNGDLQINDIDIDRGYALDVVGSALITGKVNISTGSNASVGTATLASGTVTVSTTAVTANSIIIPTYIGGSVGSVPSLSISAKVVGTSFTVVSSNASDSGIFTYLIIN